MPNPLMMATTSPAAPAKPDKTPHEPREAKGTATFQKILEQDSPTPEAETGAQLTAEPDPEAEVDETTENPDVAEAPPALRESPPPSPQPTDKQPSGIDTTLHPLPHAGGEARLPATPSAATPNVGRDPITRGHGASSIETGTPIVAQRVATGSDSARQRTSDKRATGNNTQISAFPIPAQNNGTLASFSVDASSKILPEATRLMPSQKQLVIPNHAPSLAQMQLLVGSNSDLNSESAAAQDTEKIIGVGDAPAPSGTRETTPGTTPPPVAPRADTARAIAGQMAAVINARPGSGAVEVALNPEELGRVSIVLNGREDGLHMTIAAERPETLDLMRRHISVLASEFEKLGYGGLSFDLGTSPDAHQNGSDAQNGSSFDPPPPESDPAHDPVIKRTSPDGGIDMRL